MTVALAVVAIIWHQQRTIDKLRDGTSQSIDKLRDDTDRGLAKLGAAIAANGERLARIEGFLGIGMPDAAASRAAGATLPKQDPGQAEGSGPS
ncbi:MAG: hypothetical protein F4126_09970 [Acidimicrobiaceae bacterium]|nr:hypothetical protein [Acidimicrobiaceae bacterium]MYB87420.1 hypothetical protein [Acidimicrobiaceae bacterium]MYH94034.1 hypothetical protein [Acidimicrobiaceae bacterium]